jgi:PAS domain S-box-containing protein
MADEAQPLAPLQASRVEPRLEIADLRETYPEGDRSPFHDIPSKSFQKDRDLVYVWCNGSYAADFGLTPAQMVGKTDYDLYPSKLAEKYQADDRLIMASGEAEEFEEGYRTPDGQESVVCTVKSPLKDKDGQTIGILGVFHDLTARRQIELLLKEKERRLFTLMSNLPGMAYRCRNDINWAMEFVSEGCLALTGYPCSELQDNRIVSYGNLIHPDDRQMVWDRVQEAVAGRRHFQFEYRICTAIGELKWVWEQGVGVYASDGRLEALEGFICDINDRKRDEDLLRLSEAKYRRIVDTAIDGIWAFGPDGATTFVNARMAEMLGCCVENILGRPMTDFLFDEDVPDYDQKFDSRRRGIAENYERRFRRRDGQTVWTLASATPLFDASNYFNGSFAMFTEITERKRAEEELRTYKEHLEELVRERTLELAAAKAAAEVANQAKSAFLASMSHEIRTPMTAILGYADLLMEPTLSSTNRCNYAATIRRSGEHLLSLINDILDLSKIEAGKMVVNVSPCNLVATINEAACIVRPRAVKRGISFTVEYPGDIPATIRMDGERLRQVIINLAGNAVKFTENGSVRIVTTFLPEGIEGQPAIRIEVIDTGIGIREDVLPTLFRPFSQDAVVARSFGGTGLGLAISHHLATLMGGSLTVHSVLGRGSTFTLLVPTGDLQGVPMLRCPIRMEGETIRQVWSEIKEELKGVQILLAEDGIDNRELIQAVLQKAGAEVETAENGREAVAKAEVRAFDIILMDMNMPEMDGYTATALLREHGLRQPILALTANAMAGDTERCLAVGCNEHLTKPIDRIQLIRTIAEFVGPKKEPPSKSNPA